MKPSCPTAFSALPGDLPTPAFAGVGMLGWSGDCCGEVHDIARGRCFAGGHARARQLAFWSEAGRGGAERGAARS